MTELEQERKVLEELWKITKDIEETRKQEYDIAHQKCQEVEMKLNNIVDCDKCHNIIKISDQPKKETAGDCYIRLSTYCPYCGQLLYTEEC